MRAAAEARAADADGDATIACGSARGPAPVEFEEQLAVRYTSAFARPHIAFYVVRLAVIAVYSCNGLCARAQACVEELSRAAVRSRSFSLA